MNKNKNTIQQRESSCARTFEPEVLGQKTRQFHFSNSIYHEQDNTRLPVTKGVKSSI